jgi:hypothetical protein
LRANRSSAVRPVLLLSIRLVYNKADGVEEVLP